MKKNFIKKYSLYLLIALPFTTINIISQSCVSADKVKTAILPIDDSHPLRYNFYKIKPQEDDSCWSLDGKASYMYQRSYNNCKTASTLFHCNPLSFSALKKPVNINVLDPRNFLFGDELDDLFKISYNPQIQNNILDLSATLHYYTNSSSFYINLAVPVEHSSFKLKTESKNIKSEDGLFANDFTKGELLKITTADVNKNILVKSYINSEDGAPFTSIDAISAKTIFSALSGHTSGDLKKRNYGKINTNDMYNCSSEWNLSNIILQTGWNAIEREYSHLGVYVKAGLPLGTKLDKSWAKYTFSPVIGNGRRFELGLGLNAHTTLRDTDCDTLQLHIDGYISHIFAKDRFAIFDLKNKPMTRYNLTKAFKSSGAAAPDSPYQYADLLFSVADITGQCIKVGIPVRGEAIIDIHYARSKWNAHLGYSFIGEQAEKTSCCPKLNSTYKYAIKGLSSVEYFKQDTDFTNTINNAINYTTEYVSPNATAYSYGEIITFNGNESNGEALYGKILDLNHANEYLLNDNDINICSALMDTKIVHKLFANFEYNWEDKCYSPKLGIFGSIGISPISSYTPEMWDIGLYIGGTY